MEKAKVWENGWERRREEGKREGTAKQEKGEEVEEGLINNSRTGRSVNGNENEDERGNKKENEEKYRRNNRRKK